MTIKQFIEKAIEGGWRKKEIPRFRGLEFDFGIGYPLITFERPSRHQVERMPLEVILLDPLAWQAVGKVEGWDTDKCFLCKRKLGRDNECIEHGWNHYWRDAIHRMIDALAEGKKVEQFLETL